MGQASVLSTTEAPVALPPNAMTPPAASAAAASATAPDSASARRLSRERSARSMRRKSSPWNDEGASGARSATRSSRSRRSDIKRLPQDRSGCMQTRGERAARHAERGGRALVVQPDQVDEQHGATLVNRQGLQRAHRLVDD